MEHSEADRQHHHDVSVNTVPPHHKKTRARLQLLMDFHLEANAKVAGYSDPQVLNRRGMASNAAAGSNDTTDSNADSIALSDIEFSDVDFDHAVESSDDSDSDFEFEDEVERISTTAEEEVTSQRPY
ncbi:hypothetical protein F442_23102, partial [Phytophthora nicotianae P10297]